MNLVKKVKTAFRILKEEGFDGIFSVVKRKLDGSFRPDETRMAFELLDGETHQGIMLDIGAHHGASLFPFAKAGWQVYAFEPDAVNRARLSEAISQFPRVEVDPRAVSDHAQAGIPFFRSEESSGVSSLAAFLPTHEQAGNVDVTTLADFFTEKGLHGDDVDFLKIDTEGFDLMVLKGINWHQGSPRVILCEFEDSKTLPLGYSYHMMAGYLVDKGYKLVVSEWKPIVHYGAHHQWRGFNQYPCKLQHARGWGNLFAVKDNDLYARLLQACRLAG